MNSGDLMIVLIVAVVMIASVMRARYGYGRNRFGRGNPEGDPQARVENQRLRDEVTQLKDRIKVLERITVEKENSLANEIESLRDR